MLIDSEFVPALTRTEDANPQFAQQIRDKWTHSFFMKRAWECARLISNSIGGNHYDIPRTPIGPKRCLSAGMRWAYLEKMNELRVAGAAVESLDARMRRMAEDGRVREERAIQCFIHRFFLGRSVGSEFFDELDGHTLYTYDDRKSIERWEKINATGGRDSPIFSDYYKSMLLTTLPTV